ncbi:CoA pyrophosphatase [Aestuariibacter sp. AA17]|uniref:CoA pyrophosphatase n=1 Tax=Fluctibacter corallii TaxID=2984329 RepID=A0ABT3A9E8_9ALTE|nr:CoA pyrophosphatase [Aestuariibacter sp. AA17]MCV2885274.1 CoA pyrophosphatase [Aestuariibacter sp. AA17]
MNKDEFLAQFQHVRVVPPESDFPLRVQARPAAVLLPIVVREDSLTMLFTQRARHLRHHAGQISFPGGKQEPTDKSLLDTALRETEEEIGITRQYIDVIGTLPKFRTVSRFEVLPFVSFVSDTFSLKIDENEVDNVFEVPLAFLLDKTNHFIHWVERKKAVHPIYFIPWENKQIWGATAAFIRNLSNHIHHKAN